MLIVGAKASVADFPLLFLTYAHEISPDLAAATVPSTITGIVFCPLGSNAAARSPWSGAIIQQPSVSRSTPPVSFRIASSRRTWHAASHPVTVGHGAVRGRDLCHRPVRPEREADDRTIGNEVGMIAEPAA